uniref:AB hydrolase-1 domain-containing protein n=1 Tax=Ciona savignyi TaxID=51511 RepID=H2ZR72_CIOSA
MDSSAPYISTSARGLSKEIEIPVAWGVIAGKTFGSPSNPPVLCLHGWLDNCNSFDKLIPLLPEDKYYVAIDIPGHGLSSGIPIGMYYSIFGSVSAVESIANYFNWKKFSLLGHSLGGNINAMYSGTFPDKVDKLIIIDVIGAFPVEAKLAPSILSSSIQSYLNYETKLHVAAPRYTYDEAKHRLMTANKSLDNEAADIFLERGTRKHEDGKYSYTRDLRHRFRNPMFCTPETAVHFLNQITASTLHVMASEGSVQKARATHKEGIEKLFASFTSVKKSEYVLIEGDHHLHMVNAEQVAKHISAFLNHVTQEPSVHL